MNEIDELLEDLRRSCTMTGVSRNEIKISLKNLLLWLNESTNDTDKNCIAIDHFVALEIISNNNWQYLPEDIQNLLFDLGGTLHAAKSNPEVAENFESMPKQLLARIDQLP